MTMDVSKDLNAIADDEPALSCVREMNVHDRPFGQQPYVGPILYADLPCHLPQRKLSSHYPLEADCLNLFCSACSHLSSDLLSLALSLSLSDLAHHRRVSCMLGISTQVSTLDETIGHVRYTRRSFSCGGVRSVTRFVPIGNSREHYLLISLIYDCDLYTR